MKKAFLALTGLAFLTGMYSFTPGTENKAASTLTVNTEKSRIDWVASKKSDFHTGSFPIKSGEVMVDGGKLTGGKFVIDLANLKVTDGAGDRLGTHLKSPDFFDVTKFGEATYEITGVIYSGDNNTAELSGNLTVKGVSVPVKLDAKIRNSDEKGFFAQAFLTLDKTLVGINYGKGNVSNDVQLAIHIFAK
jgi:polyisoprenoid-binding protein YceI